MEETRETLAREDDATEDRTMEDLTEDAIDEASTCEENIELTDVDEANDAILEAR